jgi:ArsR family transcriptional regulator
MYIVNLQAEHLFQALADPTRIRVVRLLAATGEEACLCELVDSLLEPQYKLSRHVKILRQAGLLSAEKEGRWVYHRLVTGAGYLTHLYETVRALPDPDGQFAGDLERFEKRRELRVGGRCRVGIQHPELAVQ